MMVKVDFEGNQPKFKRPEILQHGQIPRPMAGVAPRVIFGQEWWDVERKKAYAANNYCCWACGAYDALDAHEVYDIDYMKLRMKFIEVVAVCRNCHMFIHAGLTKRTVTASKFKKIVLHGYKILKAAKLKINWGLETLLPLEPWTWKIRNIIGPRPPMQDRMYWGRWRLVIVDNEYPPKFSSEAAADKFYASKEMNDE